MADIPFSQVSGSGGSPRLAPDLTWPSRRASTGKLNESITVNASGGLTTLISLTGKYIINYIALTGLTIEMNTIKLTVDGVIVWNDSYNTSPTDVLISSTVGATGYLSEFISCNSSFLLEYQTASDTSINVEFLVRPIL